MRSHRLIQLTGGGATVVDAGDYSWLMLHKWSACRRNGKQYARRTVKVNGKWRCLFMHRAIMDAPAGVQVDHRNGDGLDNQRSNLRLATLQQNRCNTRLLNPNGARGIYRKDGKWCAQIQVNKRKVWLGRFTDKTEAAKAYAAAAKKYHGEFASEML